MYNHLQNERYLGSLFPFSEGDWIPRDTYCHIAYMMVLFNLCEPSLLLKTLPNRSMSTSSSSCVKAEEFVFLDIHEDVSTMMLILKFNGTNTYSDIFGQIFVCVFSLFNKYDFLNYIRSLGPIKFQGLKLILHDWNLYTPHLFEISRRKEHKLIQTVLHFRTLPK